MPSPYIPARDDSSEFQGGLRRGEATLETLTTVGVDVKDKSVLDLGAGYGFLSLAAARQGARSVLSVDVSDERLGLIAARAKAEGLDVQTRQANLLDAWTGPTDVDVAFLIGVVEYAGLFTPERKPSDLQVQVLSSAYQALKPGGQLVFASKNRWWPRHLVKDFHTHLPLVNAVPRRVADRISQARKGTPFRHHIHGPRGWERLVRRAGFEDVQLYVPYLSYQLPLLLSAKPSFQDLKVIRARDLSPDEASVAFGRTPWRVAGGFVAACGQMGVQCGPHVLAVATKTRR